MGKYFETLEMNNNFTILWCEYCSMVNTLKIVFIVTDFAAFITYLKLFRQMCFERLSRVYAGYVFIQHNNKTSSNTFTTLLLLLLC